jgi:hypothetical protein
MNTLIQLVLSHPGLSAVLLCALIGLAMMFYGLATAKEMPEVEERRPRVRELSMADRLQLRQQIYHEQEEAEAHNG